MKILFFFVCSAASFVCFAVECYEIIFDINIAWSDHLHNLIDHIMYVAVNFIGISIIKKRD